MTPLISRTRGPWSDLPRTSPRRPKACPSGPSQRGAGRRINLASTATNPSVSSQKRTVRSQERRRVARSSSSSSTDLLQSRPVPGEGRSGLARVEPPAPATSPPTPPAETAPGVRGHGSPTPGRPCGPIPEPPEWGSLPGQSSFLGSSRSRDGPGPQPRFPARKWTNQLRMRSSRSTRSQGSPVRERPWEDRGYRTISTGTPRFLRAMNHCSPSEMGVL